MAAAPTSAFRPARVLLLCGARAPHRPESENRFEGGWGGYLPPLVASGRKSQARGGNGACGRVDGSNVGIVVSQQFFPPASPCKVAHLPYKLMGSRGGSNVSAGGFESPCTHKIYGYPWSTPFNFFTMNDKLKVKPPAEARPRYLDTCDGPAPTPTRRIPLSGASASPSQMDQSWMYGIDSWSQEYRDGVAEFLRIVDNDRIIRMSEY
uniref:Uncharacterized protein n=1 Tax=Oryza sativa subsp. japonica TaxID=39947 RepID=Q8H4R2_ORYSJ|nr:hypothetical protein [Oryza sativa Japonica Group]